MNASLASVFREVFEASWQGGLGVLAVLLVRSMLGRSVPPWWRHALWLLVALRLLVPAGLFPAYSFNVQHVAVLSQRLDRVEDVLDRRLLLVAPAAKAEMTEMATRLPQAAALSGWSLAGFVWLAGVGGLSLFLLAIHLRLRARIATETVPPSPEAAAAWARMGPSFPRRPMLVATRAVDSPALIGLFHPRLLIPADHPMGFTEGDWENVFAHELAHHRRGDLWTHFLALLVLGIHWFNPLVWIAFRRVRADAELAADDWALRRLAPDGAHAYGETLLRVVDRSARGFLPVGTLGILEARPSLLGAWRAEHFRTDLCGEPRGARGRAPSDPQQGDSPQFARRKRLRPRHRRPRRQS